MPGKVDYRVLNESQVEAAATFTLFERHAVFMRPFRRNEGLARQLTHAQQDLLEGLFEMDAVEQVLCSIHSVTVTHGRLFFQQAIMDCLIRQVRQYLLTCAGGDGVRDGLEETTS